MKKKIITGITVEEQMKRAKVILENEIIPQNKNYNTRKKRKRSFWKPFGLVVSLRAQKIMNRNPGELGRTIRHMRHEIKKRDASTEGSGAT